MSFIDEVELSAFAKINSWLTNSPVDPGLDKIINQVDSIIFNKTGVTVPATPNDDAPILKNIACVLVIYFTTSKQQGLLQDERLYRQKLYDDAMAYLDDVENGLKSVYDSDGNVISSTRSGGATVFITSEKRITGTL